MLQPRSSDFQLPASTSVFTRHKSFVSESVTKICRASIFPKSTLWFWGNYTSGVLIGWPQVSVCPILWDFLHSYCQSPPPPPSQNDILWCQVLVIQLTHKHVGCQLLLLPPTHMLKHRCSKHKQLEKKRYSSEPRDYTTLKSFKFIRLTV